MKNLYKRRFSYSGTDRYLAIALVWGVIIIAALAMLWHIFGPQEGRIYQKNYYPAHYVQPTKDDQGNTITPGHWIEERYTLSVETYWNDRRVTNSFDVPRYLFEEARIGDWYDHHCVCLEEDR